MKYIDADKLIAEIERRIMEHKKSLKKDITLISEAMLKGSLGAYESIEHFIDSLQQEPPADGDDGKFVKILVRKEFAERFQKLGDEVQAGQSSFVEAMNQQEQPEVDLEKAFAHEYAIYHLPDFIIASIVDGTELIDFIYKTARHFAEWGATHINARKEE